MTTILCDVNNGLMGADSAQDHGGLQFPTRKILAGNYGIVAWSGRHEEGLLWFEWIAAGASPKDRPAKGMNDFSALHLTPDGVLYRYDEYCVPVLVNACYYGIGSGRDFALATLYCWNIWHLRGEPEGCESPPCHVVAESIRVACHFDLYSSPPIVVYSLANVSKPEVFS